MTRPNTTAASAEDREFTVLFAAGKWSVPRVLAALYYAALVRFYRPDVLITTESQAIGLPSLLRAQIGRIMRVQRRREFIIATRRAKIPGTRRLRIRQITRVRGLPNWRQTRLASLEAKIAGVWVWLGASHPQAGVDGGGKYRTDREARPAVEGSRESFKQLGKALDDAAARGLPGGAFFDGNVNQHKMLELTEELVGHPSVWREHMPDGGTHDGARLIDTGHIVGLIVVAARILRFGKKAPRVLRRNSRRRKKSRFDHAPILLTLRIPKETR